MLIKDITRAEREVARNAVYFDEESVPLWLNTDNWIERTCKRCGRWYLKRDPRGDCCTGWELAHW